MPQTTNVFDSLKTATGKAGKQLIDAQFAAFIADRHGKYYTGAYLGASGFAANQSGATSSVALATTYTGFCLSNPAGSGKNLAIQRVNALLNVAAAGPMAIGLIGGFAAAGVVTHTTPLVVQNGVVGASASGLVAKADAACTLVGTPAWMKWLGLNPATATLGFVSEDIDGAIIVPPGGYLAIGTLIASGASGLLASMGWEELPI